MARPTFHDIEDWLAARRTDLSEMHTEMREDSMLYAWTDASREAFKVAWLAGLPTGFTPRLPPLARLGVQTGVNHIIAGEDPECEIVPPRTGKKRAQSDTIKEKVEAMEAFGNAWLHKVCTYATGNPIRDVVTLQLECGQGALSYPINYSAWPEPPFGMTDQKKPRKGRTADERAEYSEWEAKRRDAFPWQVSSIHPTGLFFDIDNDPPKDFILVDKVTWGAVADKYDHISDGDHKRTERVERIQYCSEEWYGVWVDSQPCLTGEDAEDGVAVNTAGHAWTRMCWSGHGDQDEDNSWERRGRGVLRDRDVILILLATLNVAEVMRLQTAFPQMMISGGTADQRRMVAEQYGYGIGGTIELPDGVSMTPVTPPTPPDVVWKEQDMAERLYSMQYGADVLSGEYRSEPAAKQRARSTAAALPFGAPQANAQQMVAAVLGDIFRDVKYQLRDTVTIDGVSLSPSQIIDGVAINVNFMPLSDEEKSFKRAEALEDLGNGTMTKADYIRTTRGIDNPEEVLSEVRVEQMTDAALAAPEVLAVVVQQIVPPSPDPAVDPATGMPVAEPGMEEAAPMEQQVEPPAPETGGPFEAQEYAAAIGRAPLLPQGPGVNGR